MKLISDSPLNMQIFIRFIQTPSNEENWLFAIGHLGKDLQLRIDQKSIQLVGSGIICRSLSPNNKDLKSETITLVIALALAVALIGGLIVV